MTATVAEILVGPDVVRLLTTAAADQPRRVYAREHGRDVTVGELAQRVRGCVDALSRRGVSARSRVAVMLPNSVEHIALIFALAELGALWVPLNTRAVGAPLEHILADSAATHVVALTGSDSAAACARAHTAVHGAALVDGAVLVSDTDTRGGQLRMWHCGRAEPGLVSGTRALMYTSGTTGPPKGVRVSDTMLRASAYGSLAVTDAASGDVLYLWEPLFHIGGAQMPLLPLLADVSLAVDDRFRASQFWERVAVAGGTHIHYLGGILQMLLHQPPHPRERRHGARVAWGAGASPEVWRACEQRFGLRLHECYGMTETSSVVCVNRSGPEAGIGTPLPWFDVRLDAPDGSGGGRPGEILVRGRLPGLVTAGYLGREPTGAETGDAWFRTGDLAQRDPDGNLHFAGRANDTIRVRGENLSAWQVENVFADHPIVERCAAVGVDAEVGEQEILLCVTVVDGTRLDPARLLDWAVDRLPSYQLPRYVKVLPELPLTPSQRVAKKRLPTDVDEAFDRRRA